MKKLLWALPLLVSLCWGDSTVANLDTISNPTTDEILYVIETPVTSTSSQKMTIGELLATGADLNATGEVTDDSHAHTGATLSSIDISADTNLAVTAPVVLTDDTISVDSTVTQLGPTIQESEISDLSHTTDTGPSPDCSGTTTYQDGEGGCDDISAVYAPITGSGNYIQETDTLQSGATFYVSSGTVDGQLSLDSIKWPDGTIQISSPTAGGGGEGYELEPATVTIQAFEGISYGTTTSQGGLIHYMGSDGDSVMRFTPTSETGTLNLYDFYGYQSPSGSIAKFGSMGIRFYYGNAIAQYEDEDDNVVASYNLGSGISSIGVSLISGSDVTNPGYCGLNVVNSIAMSAFEITGSTSISAKATDSTNVAWLYTVDASGGDATVNLEATSVPNFGYGTYRRVCKNDSSTYTVTVNTPNDDAVLSYENECADFMVLGNGGSNGQWNLIGTLSSPSEPAGSVSWPLTAEDDINMANFQIINVASMTMVSNQAPVISSTWTTLTVKLTDDADTDFHIGEDISYANGAKIFSTATYVDTNCIYITTPTATDDFESVWYTRSSSITITAMWCESDQTVNLDLQIDDGTPADVNGTDLVCASTPVEDSTLGGDTSMGWGDRLDLAITSVSGDPTWVSVCYEYYKED